MTTQIRLFVLLALAAIGLAAANAPAQTTGPCVTINCPTNIVTECNGTNGAVANFTVTATTICGRLVTVTCTPPSGSVFPPGATTVTCLAVDSLQNGARCEFAVKVVDTTPPVIIAPTQVVAPCSGPSGAAVNFEVSARDICDSQPRLYCVPPSGSMFPLGTTTVVCVAVDGMNNQSTTTFTVIVTGDCDANCLAISCGRDLELAVRAGTSRAVAFSVTATNHCGGFDVPVYCQPPSGSVFPMGTTTVYCTATNSGIVKKCSFDVTIKDTTPPKITAPHVLTVPCQGFVQGQSSAPVSYPITVADNTDPSPTLSCTPPSGSWLPVGTNSVTCIATDASGNAATNRFQVVVTLGPGCTVSAPVTELSPDNWGFELGITSWTPSGSAFENQPTGRDSVKVHRIPELKQQMDENIGGGYWQDLSFRVGYRGHYWVGTAENQPFEAGELFNNYPPHDESLTGQLLSKPFTIATDYISFLVGGTSDPDNVHVDLLVEADKNDPGAIHLDGYYTVEYSTTGHGRELMRRAAWAMDNVFHHVLGKKARIRIVDQSPTGHINVDDFQFVNTHPHFQKVKIGGQEYPAVVMFDRYEYDWDSPVWGFADLHTHPMSHLGFAEKVMHGAPDGGANDPTNIALALPDCNCTHGGGGQGTDNPCGNYLRQALQMGTDDKANDQHREGWVTDRIENKDGREYARFRHWPVFTTKTHQQMWYEWIKRTYDGGLRVMVALCVNNGLLGSASEGEGPKDDLTVGDHQIQALKDFVARHDDFMEIAYDPFQLRDIVRRDKLAIVIGSELDDIGNLCTNKNVHADPADDATDVDVDSKQAALHAIDHLYNQGVRYIFPVHLVNNKFGGSPIAEVMLNVANYYLNGEALQVELSDPGDLIRFSLPTNFDLSAVIEEHKPELIFGIVALPLVLPAILSTPDLLGVTPPGSGAAIGAGLLPVALLAGVGLLPDTLKAIPPQVWPIDHHYPIYPVPVNDRGHVNKRGLTRLGEFAVREMMKRGMMIDVDHMSQKTLNKVFEMAEANSVGYPLNSGHNSFRALSREAAENHRTDQQMNRIRDLGGLYGVGYENSDVYSPADVWMKELNYSTSQVDNDCAGTSRTVSQTYIYGLERMLGHNIAFGTDMNGLIAGPGPRFGPNSDFANEDRYNISSRIRGQDNGVLYDQKHGRPIVGPAFIGKGVDPKKIQGFPFPAYKDDNYVTHFGAAYSQEQRDFFMSIRIYYHLKPKVDNGWTQQQVENELQKIRDVISDGYDKDGVRDLALGLLEGIKTWPTGISPTEQAGYYVYREEVLHEIIPQSIKDTVDMPPPFITLANPYERLMSLRAVWYDYHHIFGNNPPLKRCKTGPKDWDINFEGVAHYGLIPDLLQDMVNVGMEVSDLDPLFQSAEGLAQMWTKCLRAADDIVHPYVNARTSGDVFNGLLTLEWNAEDTDQLEEIDELAGRSAWRRSDVPIQIEKGRAHAVVRLDPNSPKRFYRVSKP